MMKRVCTVLSCLFVSVVIGKIEAVQAVVEDAALEAEKEWIFEPFVDDFRDPFYSLSAVEKAHVDLESYRKARDLKEQAEKDFQETVVDRSSLNLNAGSSDLDKALAKAREFSAKAEQSLLEMEWEKAVKDSEKGLAELEKVARYKEDPQYRHVVDQRELLNGFMKNAQEAQLNQEAEARFNALNLQVQGIMWSADKKSLAIISGYHVYVQGKIGKGADTVTVVNIDPNRVDFMINYERRRFEFKRFIGE